jgi:hypothetical protein
LDHPAIFLFDLDGVLVQPAGYREAVRATINYFTRRLGISDLAPDEEILALLESQGITNEWDIIPICLGEILETILRENPDLHFSGDLLDLPKSLPYPKGPLHFREDILKISSLLQAGFSPSEALLRSREKGPFLELSRQSLFNNLFEHNQDVTLSVTSRTFQNYVLGSQAFTEIYQVPAIVEGESYLKVFDRPLLANELKRHMEDMIFNHTLHVAALTARPSLAPRDVSTEPGGYSPEAEQALELVGLSQIPLIGFGRLQYAASQLHISPNLLMKPAPYQALAAVLAAVGGSELAALKSAAAICHQAGLIPESSSFTTLDPTRPLISTSDSRARNAGWSVHIFEDSPIGIRAVQQAGELLNRAGIRVRVHCWGIAQNPDKVLALEQSGATVFSDINLALEQNFSKDFL